MIRFPAGKAERNTLAAAAAASFLLTLTGFVLANRANAGGLSNAANPVYWMNRSVGKDLFDADERIWHRGVRDRMEVALTFDDGPHPTATEPLLNILKEKNCPASFFVVGKNVDARPDLVRRMIDEGHEVANHTFDHVRLHQLSLDQVREQLVKCDESIEKAVGRKAVFMRPPGLRTSDNVMKVVNERGYVMVHYTMGAKDFVGTGKDYELTPELKKLPKTTPESVLKSILKQLKPGGIILLHDNPVTVSAMSELIDKIRDRGYEIKLCSDMMAALPHGVRIDPNPVLRK